MPLAEPIHNLFIEGRWDEIRGRVDRLRSSKMVTELLCHQGELPGDIFEILLEKERSTGSYSLLCDGLHGHGREWCTVRLRDIMHYQSPASVKALVNLVLEVHRDRKLQIVPYIDPILENAPNFVRLMEEIIHSMWRNARTDIMLDHWNHQTTLNEIKELISDQQLAEECGDLKMLAALWEKTEILLNVISKAKGDKSLPWLHLLIQMRFPKYIVWIALILFPDAAASMRDKDGRLPLHVAAELNNENTLERDERQVGRQAWQDRRYQQNLENVFYQPNAEKPKLVDQIQKMRIFDIIFDAFPEGAEIEDSNGLLPLDILLDIAYRSWWDNDWTQRCIMKLVQQNPDSLTRVNPLCSNMFPFMVAASMDDKFKGHGSNCESSGMHRKLELTYALLSKNPSVILSDIEPTTREEKTTALAEKNHKSRQELARVKKTRLDIGVSEQNEPATKKARL